MNRIEKKFADLKSSNRKALIIFITAGDPDLATTEAVVPALFKAGADIVELGIPFSDPLADGPTIQESFTRALARESNLKNILEMVKRIRKKCDGPIVFMSSYNLIHSFGHKRFANEARAAGVDGAIIPDIIPEESDGIAPELVRKGIAPIFLAAPTSGPDRLKKIADKSRGFVYYISVAGITGKQRPVEQEVRKQVENIKRFTNLPVACGFGISTPQQAAEIAKVADGAIIGSAAVRLLAEKAPKTKRINTLVDFVRRVRTAMDGQK